MSKTHGPERGLPETTSDLSQTSSQGPETLDAPQTSPEALHEQGLGNSERAARLGLGGGAEMPALADLDVDAWMNDGDEAHTAPLPYKAELERGFGADLSGVQVRLGAEEELHAQGAEATADGETLSFASKHPDRELVAHEVAHLVQSREHGGSSSSRVSEPNEAAEVEADAAAKTVAEGGEAELNERVTGVMRAKKPKNNNPNKGYSARWGFTAGGRDLFKLEDGTGRYFGDGTKYKGTGAWDKVVYINYLLVENFHSVDGKKMDAVLVHGLNGGNFFVDIEGILPTGYLKKKGPKGYGRRNTAGRPGKFWGMIRRACEKRIQSKPKLAGSDKKSTFVARMDDLSKQQNLKDARRGSNAKKEKQVSIFKNGNVRDPSADDASENLISHYLPGRKVKEKKANGKTENHTIGVYLNLNTPDMSNRVAPTVGGVLPWSKDASKRGFDDSVLEEVHLGSGAKTTPLFHHKPNKHIGNEGQAKHRWGTAQWKYVRAKVRVGDVNSPNTNLMHGWVLWEVKKNKKTK